ncbi:hypothetical protein NA57DRAFT_58006 [Rhizodiscina lignyota]|uniref:Uncharacterized protein n=1 Tax=Rhizodiscina lignyota TaxID=1504668 RepID=A0A9P4ID02_9PEZI|nr:hypothetical protein NA57DRAFT_58006 [Rhizodiscina lignyota]
MNTFAIVAYFMLAIAIADAQFCPANETCADTSVPYAVLQIKATPECSGPNVTIQQCMPAECIATASFLSSSSGTFGFRGTLVNGGYSYVPTIQLFPGRDCVEDASDLGTKSWTLQFSSVDGVGRMQTACHRFAVNGTVPASVKLNVRRV